MKTTPNERWLLAALIAAGGNATPAELIAAYPERFPGADNPDGQEIRSATSGLHLTGASLVRKGLATRGRRQIDRHGDGVLSGGPRLYRLTAAARKI